MFYIPGVYLEYPADPWEHYARINEWSWLHAVGEHSSWTKSSYFLAYSLIGRISAPTRQLFWLDFYYTGACLLLCWQYYRLGRAVGFGERASFIFVLVQALTFGNNIFGFYRYYGISSSIFAQLGAVALVRIAIEALKAPEQGAWSMEHGKPYLSPLLPAPRSLLRGSVAAAALLPLIAFNHIQGLGIAGLGLAAVAIWRLIEWRRSMVFWLATAALVLNVATILWWPRHPALDEVYRPQGWLTSWYGFNLFSPSSPAGDRTIVILGFFGAVNLVAGLLLLRRNHVAAWLTVTPLFALCLPFVAVSFANVLARSYGGEDSILTFHRMLLSIPAGLAIVCLGREIAGSRFKAPSAKFLESSTRILQEETKRTEEEGGKAETTADLPGASTAPNGVTQEQAHPALSFKPKALSSALHAVRFPAFPLFLLSLTALLLVPADRQCYNRFWQALMVPPDDLQLKPVVSATKSAITRLRAVKHLRLAAPAAVAYVLDTISLRHPPRSDRSIGQPITKSLNDAIAIALSGRHTLNLQFRTLTNDPLAADPSAWTTIAGSPPEFAVGIKDFSASSTALQNPPGQRSYVFISNLIPIDPTLSYRIEFSAKQSVGTSATAYLAVAWYNERGRLLESNIPAPAGAGKPVGWANGAYSYYGLIGEIVPTTWTTYRKSFGLDEAAAIPSHAKFVRVGALLNYNETLSATILLTNVRLWRKSQAEMMADGAFSSDEHLFIIAPSGRMVWTNASQAAQASHHWPAQQVAVDLAGGAELTTAAHTVGGTSVDRDSMVFDLEKGEPSKPKQ